MSDALESVDRPDTLGVADRVLVAAGALLVFVARTLPFHERVLRGRPWPEYGDGDVLAHLRRIQLTETHWPRVPDFDSWMSYPDGGLSAWPPLFDFVPASVARFTGWPAHVVGSYWTPLLSALTVVPMYALLAGLFGKPAARIALVLFALLPGSVFLGVLGRIDHHVAELLLQMLLYAHLLVTLERLDRGRAPSTRRALGLGALMGTALLTWMGSVLFLVVVPATAGLYVLCTRDATRARALTRHVLIAMVTGAALALPYGLLNVSRGRAPFGTYYVSLLQPILCVVLGLSLIAGRWVSDPLRSGERGRALQRAGAILLGFALFLLWSGFRDAVAAGLAFVTRTENAFVTEIAESVPFWANPNAYRLAIRQVGYGHMLLPLLVVGVLVRVVRERGRVGGTVLALVWLVHVTAVGFTQGRFVAYALPAISALPGVALTWLPAPRPARVVAAALALVACGPALTYWSGLWLPGSSLPFLDVRFGIAETMDAVKARTPPAGDPMDPDTRPAYCVFAPWDLGLYVVVRAHRPIVANNYGIYLEGGAYEDAHRVFHELPREAQVVSVLERRGCRYLITPRPNEGPDAATFAGRLHRGLGSRSTNAPGSGRFRLLYSAPPDPRGGGSPFRLFALLPGAELRFEGDVPAGAEVLARVTLDGTVFPYRRALFAEPDGSAHVRVSYPGRYDVVHAGHVLGTLDVSSDQVERGKRLVIRRAPPPAPEADTEQATDSP